jgi:hypothetical protein
MRSAGQSMNEVGIFRKLGVAFISISSHIPDGVAMATKGKSLEMSVFAHDCFRCHLHPGSAGQRSRADRQASVAGNTFRLVRSLPGMPEVGEVWLPDEGPGKGDEIRRF